MGREEGSIVQFDYDGNDVTGKVLMHVGDFYIIQYNNREVKVHKDRVRILLH